VEPSQVALATRANDPNPLLAAVRKIAETQLTRAASDMGET
jgi:hypothetical protein